MRVVLVAVAALLFSGCASSPAPADGADDALAADGSLPPALAAVQVPLRFSVGDYESITTYTKTFQPTDVCFPQCQGNAMQVIDLTDVVPADAPVELAVTIESDGSVSGDLTFTEAEPVQESQSGGQGGRTLSAIVVRAAAGTVELHLFHTFSGPPSPQPTTANVEVRSVVRADMLVAGVPAAVRLEPGAVLNFTGADLEQAIMILSTGAILRDVDGPFTLTVPNGTSGDSILLAYGGSAQVHGPNVTMVARRVSRIETAPKDIANGADTKLAFTTDTAPLQVGIILESKETAAFVSAAPFVGQYSVKITAPGNVVVLDETPDCQFVFCEQGFFIFGGGTAGYASGYLDEHLRAGAYEVSVQAQQANNYQAYAFYMVIL